MAETEGFPPHLFTLHYYLLLQLQLIGLETDQLQFHIIGTGASPLGSAPSNSRILLR